SIWAKKPNEYLDVEGTINVSNKETQDVLNDITITNVDKMENGRFEILSDGLDYIYNKAPVISGGDSTIDYYKGTLLETFLVPSTSKCSLGFFAHILIL
ncbi:MAG: hypothetical protein IJH34_06915, partial [Romboutsia sp.]|nr:hypothetical protein [Romboutsia sp.]